MSMVTFAGSGALLAIDAGSSGTRVTLMSVAGDVLASSSAPAAGLRTEGGGAALSADMLWNQAVSLIREVDPGAANVVGVGVAAQLGVVLVDEPGRAVEDIMLWPDGRARTQAEELAASLGPSAALLGRAVSPEMPACKVRWWAANRPAALDAARWVLSVKDYLVMRLTGGASTDETHASYTGWFDVGKREYSADLIRRTGVRPDLLPPVLCADAAAGTVQAAVARETGLPAGIAVAAGAPDGTVGALGAGAVRAGTTVDVAGTTDVLLSVVDQARWEPASGAVLNAYALRDHWVVGGPTGLTGGAVEWVSRLLGFDSAAAAFERLGENLMAAPAGSEGLSFTPALSGSRLPTWNAGERGVLSGLGPSHQPLHVLQAAHEGAAFAVLEGIDAIRATGATVDEIVLVGGLAREPDLVRLRSQLWGIPVWSIGKQDATTVGAAMLAGIAAGIFSGAQDAADALVRPAVLVGHDGADRAAIARARRRWQAAARFAGGAGGW